MRLWVRGQWIPFGTDALSQFLGHPLILEDDHRCKFSQRRDQASSFDEEVIAQLLCIPRQDFARTAAGRRVWIMRTSMTTLTQIRMTLLLSNILPNDHNFYLPLPKCQMVYTILTRIIVHVASASSVLTSASASASVLEKKRWWKLIGKEALNECTNSKNGVTGMRSWQLARGLAKWISRSQAR